MTLVKYIFVPHGIVNANTTLEEHLWYRAADVDALLVEREHAAKQQLATVTQELERTKSAMASEYEMDMNDQIRKRKAVERQLAEVMQEMRERDRGDRFYTWLHKSD